MLFLVPSMQSDILKFLLHLLKIRITVLGFRQISGGLLLRPGLLMSQIFDLDLEELGIKCLKMFVYGFSTVCSSHV
ncbi:hypothetical protein CVS40_10529 [Lucilia cuprina]|nr:hypothetical protein CVS40_10529 [Lucilia cuprina]